MKPRRTIRFVMFTGEGEHTRTNRITNRRWVLSAFGTASSASLSGADTVYAMTPLHHPSSLLMSIGGAIATLGFLVAAVLVAYGAVG